MKLAKQSEKQKKPFVAEFSLLCLNSGSFQEKL